MIHVMGVYLNYVTVLMEFVKFKAYAKQDGTMLSVTKVHLLYYINIVEKVGNVLIIFFFFFFKFTARPGHAIRKSTLQIHLYTQRKKLSIPMFFEMTNDTTTITRLLTR
jgi:hypothetical protein